MPICGSVSAQCISTRHIRITFGLKMVHFVSAYVKSMMTIREARWNEIEKRYYV